MRLTVTTLRDDVLNLEVTEDMDIQSLLALISSETDIPSTHILLFHNAIPLLNHSNTLRQAGVKHGDVIVMQRVPSGAQGALESAGAAGIRSSAASVPSSAASVPSSVVAALDFSSIAVPGVPRSQSAPASSAGRQSNSSQPPQTDNPEVVRNFLLANPDQLAVLRHNNPRLTEAINEPEQFARILLEQQRNSLERERQRMRLLTSDPFDSEAQRLIAEEIRQKNIDANMEAAMEYNPESFGMVIMLYINCLVNGHAVKAFIDSGAQTTIMSAACAERCGIMRLVDARFSGIAKGIGTQKILGRIHMGQIQIENDFLASSFSILEHQPMDMLLGLDMLKRHQCVIDLRNNVLVIGTTGTSTPFLPESELPPCARLSGVQAEAATRAQEDRDLAHALHASQKSTEGPLKGGPTTSGTGPSATGASAPSAVAMELAQKTGSSVEEAVEALESCDGDRTAATAMLLARVLAKSVSSTLSR